MKKTFLFILMGLLLFSCDPKKKQEVASQPVELNVENVISTDREQMYLNTNGDYRWYETMILLDKCLDEESPKIAEIVNIFQVAEFEDSTTADVYVHKFQHFADGNSTHESIRGFWVEDFPLNDSIIAVTYQQAFEKIQQVNFPKPHSRHVCLRNPIGPISINPQWVFGNINEQLWVDAVTGEVKNSNPAFPDEFKMPLGEWP